MIQQTDAVRARWRRVDAAMAEVALAVNSPDPSRCPDAVARVLDALYDLWELWKSTSSLTRKAQDVAVRGDFDGETAAALVHARGAKTHTHVEFGDFTDRIAERFYDHFGCWCWQAYSDPRAVFSQRDSWYETHVANQEVLPPLEAAVRWMEHVLPRPPRTQ